MKTTTKVWLGASALLALIVVLACLRCKPAEPSYQGKSLSEWIKKLSDLPLGRLDDEVSSEEQQVATALQAMSTNSVPILIAWLHQDESLAQKWLKKINRKQNFIRLPTGPDPWRRRIKAQRIFALLGPIPKSFLPQFVAFFKEPDKAFLAIPVLKYSGPEAYPITLQALHYTNSSIREWTALGLASYGTNGAFAVPALVSLLGDGNTAVRAGAVLALGQIQSNPEISIPALIKVLSDPEPSVVQAAAEALDHFGTNATTALSALQQLLMRTDLQPEQRENIDRAIKKISTPPYPPPPKQP